MKELLDRVSSYNIFNSLFPGVLFAALAEQITNYSFLQPDVLLGVFVYYFIGLVIGRIGSVIIEPILKRLSFVKFADYHDYVAMSKKDEKLDLFSEINNMYRSLASMLILLIALKSYELLEGKYFWLKDYSLYTLIVFLAILFLYSYRKQSEFITKRIEGKKKRETK
jgi:hypothetical protein